LNPQSHKFNGIVLYARKVFAKRKVFGLMGADVGRELSLVRVFALVLGLRRGGSRRRRSKGIGS
jgi:hypothetical protein